MPSCTSPKSCGPTSMPAHSMPLSSGMPDASDASAAPAHRWPTRPEAMLKQRVVTAVVMLLVLAIAAALGTTAFLALTAAVLGVACFEWLRLAGLGAPWPVILGTAFALLAFGGAWFGTLTGAAANIALFLSGAIWLVIALLLFRHEASGARLPRWLIMIACPLLLA